MSKARPVVQDSMELAKRINDSTDLVTDLTDVVQSELPQKAIQGDNPEATNSEILRAIDNIDLDTSDLAKEETLIQGVSDIRRDIANIPAPDLSTVAKQGDNPNATNTAILEAFSHIDFTALATKEGQEEAATELLILKQRIGESTDPDTAQTIFGKIAAVLTAVTNIDFSSIAKEETLSSGIIRILQELAPKATQAQLESATAAIINALPTDYAKQGVNTAATNTAILETTDTIDKKIGIAPLGNDKSTIFAYLATIYEYLAGQTPEEIPEGLGDRINLLLQFFGLPQALSEYQSMTVDEVTDYLEEIMQNIDPDLTPEKAAEITEKALSASENE